MAGPQPTKTTQNAQTAFEELPALVEQVRSAGLPTELTIHGSFGNLDGGLVLSAYRIVQEALTNSLKRVRFDIVLMDIRMPILDGLAATAAILRDPACETRVVILTTFDDDQYVYEALATGASAFLLKDAPADRLVEAIRVVAAGDSILAPAVTRRVIEQFSRHGVHAEEARAVAGLSERERDVLRLMADGLSNAEIAARLYVAEATAKTHVGRILVKLDARDRVQAVITAFRSGFAYESPDMD